MASSGRRDICCCSLHTCCSLLRSCFADSRECMNLGRGRAWSWNRRYSWIARLCSPCSLNCTPRMGLRIEGGCNLMDMAPRRLRRPLGCRSSWNRGCRRWRTCNRSCSSNRTAGIRRRLRTDLEGKHIHKLYPLNDTQYCRLCT